LPPFTRHGESVASGPKRTIPVPAPKKITTPGPLGKRRMRHESGPSPHTETMLSLFDAHYEALYCDLRRLTPPQETEDLCQQTFLYLCNLQESERKALDEDSLIRIGHSLLQARYRPFQRIHSAMRNRVLGAEREETMHTPQPTSTQKLRRVRRELSALPCDIQQSVRMVIAEKQSLQQAARRMGVTVDLVDTWTSTGLELLTKRMCNHD